jgi:uncharacterized membrane protein
LSLEPLLNVSPVIQIHAAAAILALLVGALVLFRRKGDATHRFWGKLWVGSMAVTAISSFFIWTIRLVGPFSPIHLLSLLTLFLLYRGVSYARRHQIKLHMRMMQGTYVAALVIAGLFTFYPGRIINKVVFGPHGAGAAQWLLFAAVIVGLAFLLALLSRLRPGRQALRTPFLQPPHSDRAPFPPESLPL